MEEDHRRRHLLRDAVRAGGALSVGLTGCAAVPPVDNQGDGSSFSPTDLVATALAACMLTLISIVGERDQMTTPKATRDIASALNDGQVAVGFSETSPSRYAHAFRWTPAGGMQDLGMAAMAPMAWTPGYAVLMFCMWWIMMMAMMTITSRNIQEAAAAPPMLK